MIGLLRAKGLLLPSLITVAGIAVGIALGTWQLQRLTWKSELISTIDARTGVSALPPEAWGNLKCRTVEDVGLELSCDYMKVSVRGTYDHARERYVFISVPRQPSGIGGPGYWVFTPLVLAGGGGEIAVNRGFVPVQVKIPAHRPGSQPAGEVVIEGLLRSAEPRRTFSGHNDAAGNIWYVRSPDELFGDKLTRGSGGPDPRYFYIDQTSPPAEGGLPLPLAGKIELPNRHLEYALTWFALSATLLGVFVAYAVSACKK